MAQKDKPPEQPKPAKKKKLTAIQKAVRRAGYGQKDIYIQKDMGKFWRLVMIDAKKIDVPKS